MAGAGGAPAGWAECDPRPARAESWSSWVGASVASQRVLTENSLELSAASSSSFQL